MGPVTKSAFDLAELEAKCAASGIPTDCIPAYVDSVLRSRHNDLRKRSKDKSRPSSVRKALKADMAELEQLALTRGMTLQELKPRVQVAIAGDTVYGIAAPATDVIEADIPGMGEVRFAFSGPARVSWSYERKARPTAPTPAKPAGDLLAQLEACLHARTGTKR